MSEEEVVVEKKSDKPFFITLGVLLLIIASIALFIWLSREDNSQHTYNNFPFEKEGILWFTYAEKEGQPYQIPFYHHPSELEDIVSQSGVEQLLLYAAQNEPNTMLYITLDPELKSRAVVAAVEISRLAGDRYNLLNLRTKGALTRQPADQLAAAQNPIITCDNANNETIVIWMTTGSANVITEDNRCIKLQGIDEENLVRVADKLAYMLLGIMS